MSDSLTRPSARTTGAGHAPPPAPASRRSPATTRTSATDERRCKVCGAAVLGSVGMASARTRVGCASGENSNDNNASSCWLMPNARLRHCGKRGDDSGRGSPDASDGRRMCRHSAGVEESLLRDGGARRDPRCQTRGEMTACPVHTFGRVAQRKSCAVTERTVVMVTVRPYRRGGWEVDVRIEWPDGGLTRQRRKAPVSTKNEAVRWGRQREQHLLQHRPSETTRTHREVPTLTEFSPRFIKDYAEANQQKRSGVHAKKVILRVHLEPALGHKKLDAITTADVQALKGRLVERAAKTTNNVLGVLSKLLKVAVEWEVIDMMPCTGRLLRVPTTSMQFYDFDEYQRLWRRHRVSGRRPI